MLTYVSPDGESCFPGTVQAQVTYKLTDDNALDIQLYRYNGPEDHYQPDEPFLLNLSGDPSTKITDHTLWIAADSITPIDSLAIPIGDPIAVKGSPFDFTSPKPVGQALDSTDCVQIRNGIGYDHNWVLNTGGDITKPAARLISPATGIVLEVFTTEPGLQVYSGNYQDGTHVGKKGITYPYRGAICLESQHAPDSPNHPSWPSVLLNPGQPYQSRCMLPSSQWQIQELVRIVIFALDNYTEFGCHPAAGGRRNGFLPPVLRPGETDCPVFAGVCK